MEQSTANVPIDINNLCILIATISVSWVMDKFKLTTMYYGMVYGLMLQLLLWGTTQKFNDWIDLSYGWYFIYLIIICSICYGLYYYYDNHIESIKESEYLVIALQTPSKIETYLNYIKQFEQYYSTMINTNFGDKEKQLDIQLCSFRKLTICDSLSNEAHRVSHNLNEKIFFDDKYLGVKGYFIWKQATRTVKKDNNIEFEMSFKYIEIHIRKEQGKIINPVTITDKVDNYINTINKDNITLKYIKILSNAKNHTIIIYDGKKQSVKTLEIKFMKTLFHPEKDMLWSIIKNCCLNPEIYSDKGQVGKVSFLLYGPPGSGKSTFAYRIAMCLQRHIISLDLRDHDKGTLYQILQRPNHELCKTYKNAVYLFEEFDIAIKELDLRDKNKAKLIEGYHDFAENEYDFSCTNLTSQGEMDKRKTNIQTRVDDSKNEFTIRDLLEIFQGPIPFEGMIMLANTNKYDDIKEICPELFRPGRMTPVYFGYIDKETLQDISQYYFEEKFKGYLPEHINIPTSQIIELAFESLHNSKKPIDYFSNKLNKLLN